jgi:hypothetical protein
MQTDVEPVSNLLSLSFGYAEHARDDLDRERATEVGHGVELVGLVVRRNEGLDHLAHHRFKRCHCAWGEDAADERAQPIVFRRVHHDDLPE